MYLKILLEIEHMIKEAKDSYSKTCVKQPLKNRQNKDLNDKWKLNEGQKYCRALCNTFDLHLLIGL